MLRRLQHANASGRDWVITSSATLSLCRAWVVSHPATVRSAQVLRDSLTRPSHGARRLRLAGTPARYVQPRAGECEFSRWHAAICSLPEGIPTQAKWLLGSIGVGPSLPNRVPACVRDVTCKD